MRKFHLVVVTALVGAIVACLMVRTPNASASSETEARPSLLVAQAEPAPEESAAAPAVENGAPPNDPVLNEALAKEQEHPAAAPAPTPGKPLKDAKAFAQSPKASRDAAAVKSKKPSKSKKAIKHPKKKKKNKKVS